MTAADLFLAFISLVALSTAWALVVVVRAVQDREVAKYRRIFAELRRVSTSALGSSEFPLIETIQQLVTQRDVLRKQLVNRHRDVRQHVLRQLLEATDENGEPLFSPERCEQVSKVLFPNGLRSQHPAFDYGKQDQLPEVQPSGEHTPPPVGG